MSYNPYLNFSTKTTPQTERIPGELGKNQEKNNAGGYVWKLDKWGMLDRFLILGSEGGTYYVKEGKLTKDNGNNVLECLREDGARTVNRIVEVSVGGKAPKTDPAIFALAMAAKLGDDNTRQMAFEALPEVCRIGTHLMHFAAFTELFGGWGRAQKRAVADWYNDKTPDNLAYQVVKYQNRDGWSNKDLLRLSHPMAVSKSHQAIYKWIVSGELPKDLSIVPNTILAFEAAKKATTEKQIVSLIRENGLTREMVPTQFLNSPAVWEALLEHMPMTAMIRSLGKMSNVGILNDFSDVAKHVKSMLSNEKALRSARVHPIGILAALLTYSSGKGVRGSLDWEVNTSIVEALNGAFYKSFDFVEPTNKRIVLALDVSSSMTWGTIAGIPDLTPRVASAALAMVTARTENEYVFLGFTSEISKLNISASQSIKDVCNYVHRLGFGATDCAKPMIWASHRAIRADAFVILTDNETWAGTQHPHQALMQYRQMTGIPAKLIVVGMTATNNTIGDPSDVGTLNVVGFDTATPQVISDFIRG